MTRREAWPIWIGSFFYGMGGPLPALPRVGLYCVASICVFTGVERVRRAAYKDGQVQALIDAALRRIEASNERVRRKWDRGNT